jgi:hypothetical protein
MLLGWTEVTLMGALYAGTALFAALAALLSTGLLPTALFGVTAMANLAFFAGTFVRSRQRPRPPDTED